MLIKFNNSGCERVGQINHLLFLLILFSLTSTIVLLLIFFPSPLFKITKPAKAAAGDIVAIRIVGASTTVADVTSACNIDSVCSGWVAEIDVSEMGAGGTYSLGIGVNNDPTSAKIVCTVISQGYDSNGNASTLPGLFTELTNFENPIMPHIQHHTPMMKHW
jgi:hypothetical protein